MAINLLKPIETAKAVSQPVVSNVVQSDSQNDQAQVVPGENSNEHPEEVYWGKSDITSLDDMLTDLDIEVAPEDRVVAFPQPGLGLGSIIKVRRSLPVMVVDGNTPSSFKTWVSTVGELLKEKGITIKAGDIVSPSVQTMLAKNLAVTITRVDNGQISKKIVIPYGKQTRNDRTLLKGKTKIVRYGSNGTKLLVWKIRQENGVEVERTLVTNKVIKKPVDQITAIGTKVPPRPKPRRTVGKTTSSHSGTLSSMISAAARKYGASSSGLYKIMMCESGGNRYAVSSSGMYHGLFQYSKSSWLRSGFGSYSIYDAWAQINAAAKQYGSRSGMWPTCSRGT